MAPFDKQASERAAENAWAASPELRHEFCDNKAHFIAYRVAADAGRVKEASRIDSGAMAPPAQPTTDDHQARAQAEREWQDSAVIRAEFGGDMAAYIALRAAQARGATRVIGRRPADGVRDGPDAEGGGIISNTNTSEDPVTAAAQREWVTSPALRAEFGGNLDWYVALRRAEARGIVKLHAPALVLAPDVAPSMTVTPANPTTAMLRGALIGLDVEGLTSNSTAMPTPPQGAGLFRFSTLTWPRFLKEEAASSGQPWWLVALKEPSIYTAGNADLAMCRDELRKALASVKP